MSGCWGDDGCGRNFELGLSLTVFESIDIEILIPALGGNNLSLDSFLK